MSLLTAMLTAVSFSQNVNCHNHHIASALQIDAYLGTYPAGRLTYCLAYCNSWRPPTRRSSSQLVTQLLKED